MAVMLYLACQTFGALPCAGGILDQSHILLKTLMEIHASFKRHELDEMERLEKQAEKERKKAERRARRGTGRRARRGRSR